MSWLENVEKKIFKSLFNSLLKFSRGIHLFLLFIVQVISFQRTMCVPNNWVSLFLFPVIFPLPVMKHQESTNPIDRKMVLFLLLELFVIN